MDEQMPENENLSEKGRNKEAISRRKLLASLGVAGAAAVAGGMVTFSEAAGMSPHDQIGDLSKLRTKEKSNLVGAINESVSQLSEMENETECYINVKQFGAMGDGITDDTASIQAAIQYLESNLIPSVNGSTPRTLCFPAGIYMITDSLIVTESILIRGENKSSEIRNMSETGADTIVYSNTKFLFNAGISNLSIVSWNNAGHGISIRYGFATCSFRDLYIFVRNPAKSCLFMDHSSFGGGVYDSIFEGGEYFGERWGRTAPVVDITVNGTLFNENVFRNLRITGSTGTQAIQVKNVGLSTYLVNNRYENLNFEICAGGGLYLESAKANTIVNISYWDMPVYTGTLLSMGNGPGYASVSNLLMNITRHGSSLASGVVDIHFTNSLDSVLIGFNPSGSAGAKIDFNGKRVTVLGRITATLLNDGSVVQFSALEGLKTHSLELKNAGRLHQTNGDTIVDTVINGKMLKLETKNSSGATRRIWFEPNGDSIFPIEDNVISLGKSSGRYRDMYSSRFRPGDGAAQWFSGVGSPEGQHAAVVGSLYTRVDGGAGTTLYVKEAGSGNTGWVAK